MRKSIKYTLTAGALIITVLFAVNFFVYQQTFAGDKILNEFILDKNISAISINYPLDGTIFPQKLSPKFEWADKKKNPIIGLSQLILRTAKKAYIYQR
jgi:hypothetical protein